MENNRRVNTLEGVRGNLFQNLSETRPWQTDPSVFGRTERCSGVGAPVAFRHRRVLLHSPRVVAVEDSRRLCSPATHITHITQKVYVVMYSNVRHLPPWCQRLSLAVMRDARQAPAFLRGFRVGGGGGASIRDARGISQFVRTGGGAVAAVYLAGLRGSRNVIDSHMIPMAA